MNCREVCICGTSTRVASCERFRSATTTLRCLSVSCLSSTIRLSSVILDRSCESFSSPRFSRKTIRPSTCHVRVNNGLAFPAGRIIFVTEFGSSVCVGALVCGHCRLIGYFGCRRQRHRTGQVGCSADEMGIPTDVKTDVFAVNISRVDASRSECWKFKFLEIFKIKIIYIQTTWIHYYYCICFFRKSIYFANLL